MDNYYKEQIDLLSCMEKRREELLEDFQESFEKVEFLLSIIKENVKETLEIINSYKEKIGVEGEEITWKNH